MRKTLLATTAIAALALGGNLAHAQDKSDRSPGAAPAPPAIQNAPAEKIAPAPKQGAQKSMPETTGQGSQKSDSKAPAADDKAMKDQSESNTTGQAPKSSGGDAPAAKDDATQQQKSQSGEAEKSGTAQSESDTKASGGTTGQGAAAGAASLTTEQRTKIRTVIQQQDVKPADVDFNISVGTTVPRTITLHPLPQEVITIHPGWRGYRFILVGGQLVIIDPARFVIVAVISV